MLRLIGCDVFLVLQRQPNVIQPIQQTMPHECIDGERRPKTVLIPHLGSATIETRTAMAVLAASNAAAVLGGGEPLTPVV